jgi:hypothetical protein
VKATWALNSEGGGLAPVPALGYYEEKNKNKGNKGNNK